ncbi:hypothetical protein R4Z10_11605 [Niallia sp. XMNu-256]|uniref:hypothetical protein n=1 Tax=Niallia sp. XMNu-256 TaxID=3082444 RepID=UPI0030CC5D20
MRQPIEVLLWSIALPGFGQLLNGRFLKGIVFILLEIIINVQSRFNELIVLSFLGETEKALSLTNYQWLMFYPCIYFYAMWDAYRDAGGAKHKFSFLPYVFCAYFVTVGLIYSPKVNVLGFPIGPVWLPMLSVIPGIIVGNILIQIGKRLGSTAFK